MRTKVGDYEKALRVLVGYERSVRMLLEQRQALDARIAEWQVRVNAQLQKVAKLKQQEPTHATD